jgi:hypothetical protein
MGGNTIEHCGELSNHQTGNLKVMPRELKNAGYRFLRLRHSRGNGNPGFGVSAVAWMPAFAGMTDLQFDGSRGGCDIPQRDLKLN